MSEWKRATKEVSFDELPPEMVSVIREHIRQYNLGSILSDVLLCIQTDSEKAKTGLFRGVERVQIGAVLTPRWLVWAIAGTKTKPTALSAQLINLTVQDYAQTPFAKLVPDSGIEVSGMFTDASEPASALIGLDEGAAAQKFRDAVIKAVQDAKK